MTPEEAIWMCGQAKLHAQNEQWWAEVKKWQQIAALIESLQSERDALAFRVVQMREALEAHQRVEDASKVNCHARTIYDYSLKADRARNDALALTPPAAEAQAKANEEKAALLDWLESSGASYSLEEFGWEVSVGDTTHGPNPTLIDALRAAREHESNG